ncbi:hypothetical protein AB4144_21530 [Rhizobiaceae sp. 2RAB30]
MARDAVGFAFSDTLTDGITASISPVAEAFPRREGIAVSRISIATVCERTVSPGRRLAKVRGTGKPAAIRSVTVGPRQA